MHQDGAVGVLIESVEIGTGGRESGHWEHIPKADIGAILSFFLCLCFLAAVCEHLTLPYTAL